ncbi:hypothetical protein K523DRAFT_422235 [Schizophyllum commune Tattone D]|nr:hypothetical protein K523DRAFT_422235 [Schizophyllum commune Tattone D]
MSTILDQLDALTAGPTPTSSQSTSSDVEIGHCAIPVARTTAPLANRTASIINKSPAGTKRKRATNPADDKADKANATSSSSSSAMSSAAATPASATSTPPTMPPQPATLPPPPAQPERLYDYRDFEPPPRLVYCTTAEETDREVETLEGPLGFDMEWRFSWRARTPVHGRTAVIQLADTKTILVVQISRMGGVPPKLKALIESDRPKMGANIMSEWVVSLVACLPNLRPFTDPSPPPSRITIPPPP